MIKFGRIFLIVFICGLLIIPLFHMNTAEITGQENRTLAKFPEMTKKDKPNYEFGKEFESWLGDRFWGRDKLIDTHFQTMYKINRRIENDKAFVGDDGWMFEKYGIVDVPSLEKQYAEVKKSADILKRFDDKFKGKNIPIYLVLIPDRNDLYQKYWERYYTPKPKIDQNEELIKQLADHPNIHIIYPKKEFMENRYNEDLFMRDDLHLAYKGNILVFLKTLEIIKKKEIQKELTFVPQKDNHHHIANLLGIYPKISNIGNGFRVKLNNNLYKYRTLFSDNGSTNWSLYQENKAISKKNTQNIYAIGGCIPLNTIVNPLKYFYQTTTYLRYGALYGEEEISKRDKYLKNILSKIKNNDILMLYGNINKIVTAILNI